MYTERLALLADGTYVGGLLLWSGGKYDLIDDKRIKLETRTEPGLYGFDLSGGRLTFKTNGATALNTLRGIEVTISKSAQRRHELHGG